MLKERHSIGGTGRNWITYEAFPEKGGTLGVSDCGRSDKKKCAIKYIFNLKSKDFAGELNK